MKKLGIRHQVLLLALLPTITISILLVGYFTSSRIEDLEEAFRERGKAITLRIAPTGKYALLTHNYPILKKLAETALVEHDVQSIAFYDKNGLPVASVGNQNFGFKLPRTRFTEADLFFHESESASAFIIPIIQSAYAYEKSLLGFVKVELETTSIRLREYQMLIHAGLILLFGLSISGLHALLMGRNVTRPILELTQIVDRIKQGAFNTRVRFWSYKEFNSLNEGINTMAESLQNAHQEMQNQIDQATSSLRNTLETIELQNIELEFARKTAVAASRIKSQFLADMSHEIRTPLNSIIGFLTLLNKTALSNKQQEYLNTIQKSSKNLLAIINDILDVSKIEAGKLKVNHVFMSIRECVEETLTLLMPIANEKNIGLIPLVSYQVPFEILGDPLRIKQVITNLVSNAIKFTEHGEITVRVEVQRETAQHMIVYVSVTDTGIGLSTEEQKDLFSAFTQSDFASRKYGGTGLGLVISKKLVEQMQGEIGIQSELGKGSTFWFTFVAPKMNNNAISETEQDLSFDFSQLKPILVVDDNAQNLTLIQALLEELKISVLAFDNADDAINVFKGHTHSFQMILMDIQMPGMSGIDATKILRKFEIEQGLPRIPIIALTAYAFINEQEQLVASGVDDCLIKPLEETDLKMMLIKWSTNHFPDHPTDPEGSSSEKASVKRSSTEGKFQAQLKRPAKETEQVNSLTTQGQLRYLPGKPWQGQTQNQSQGPTQGMQGKGAAMQNVIPFFVNAPIQDQTTPQIEAEQNLLIIDWKLALKIANGKKNIALELLNKLVESLPQEKNNINTAFKNQDWEALRGAVHRLHGASCYCGVPQLKHSLLAFERTLEVFFTRRLELNKKISLLENCLISFNNAANNVLNQHPKFMSSMEEATTS